MISRLFAIFILALSIPCHAVIQGEEVAESDLIARSTVAIVGRDIIYGNIEVPYYCTGTLIRPNVIVTAGHCFFDKFNRPMPLAALTVSFGAQGSTAKEGTLVRAVEDYKVYPGFNPSITLGQDLHDIAVLRIAAVPAGYAEASLAQENPSLSPDQSVLFAGFGVTDLTDRLMRTAGILHKAAAPFLRYNGSGTGLVLRDSNSLTCFGDSGGPVYGLADGKMIVYGVTSHGTGNGCAGEQIFTSVAAHREFIQSVINAWSSY